MVLGRYFFDFDAVDLYHTDLGEDGVFDSTGHIPPSKQMLADVLIGSWPKDLTDISALRSMERIGYEQVKIPKERLHALAELFREKTIGGGYSKACIAEYRDVLIFRNKGKIIGVAKICFGCLQNMIVGTTANTEFFGEDGDYQRLYEILAPFRSRQSAQRA